MNSRERDFMCKVYCEDEDMCNVIISKWERSN